METKELNYASTINVKFIEKTKFNDVGEIKALKAGVAKKLLAAGIVEEYVSTPTPVVKKESKESKETKE